MTNHILVQKEYKLDVKKENDISGIKERNRAHPVRTCLFVVQNREEVISEIKRRKENLFSEDLSSLTGLERSGQDQIGTYL